MNLILLAIFFNLVLGRTLFTHFLSSSIYKNGKMYIYETLDEYILGSGLYVYTLKDGPISDIKPKIVNFTNLDTSYTPLFLNLPPNLPNERSDQLWMLSGLHESVIKNQGLDEDHWTAQITNENELKFGSGFISKPDNNNFPKSGFTATIVNNDDNPTLHVIGGLVYSKELKTELITNYHFKYEFKTDKWSDLSKFTKSILPPVTYHKVVQADDSLILVTGYSQDYAKNGNFTDTLPSENSTQISISEMYKFDLSTEKWSTQKIKLNLDTDIYKQGLTYGPSLDIYNGKLISYMSLYDFWNSEYKPMLATLDYKSKEWKWNWINVKNEANTLNSLDLSYHNTIIINDQLLMLHGDSNQGLSKNMYAIDLKENKLQGFVNITGKRVQSEDLGNNDQAKDTGLPTWAKILISVVSIVVVAIILVVFWFCLRYKKKAREGDNNSKKMQDIWATSEVEASGNKQAVVALNLKNAADRPEQTETTLNEDSIMNYDCFKHEVDLQDMEDSKTFKIV